VNNEAVAQQPPPAQQPPLQQNIQGQQSADGYRQQQFPLRTTSHRHSTNLALEQQSPQHVQTAQYSAAPQPSLAAVDQQRRGSYQPQPTYAPQEPQKKSFRSRIAANFSGHSKDHDDGRNAKNGSGSGSVGRRVSVKKGDGRADGYQLQANDRLQAAQWAQRQGSSPHLPTSNEQDEDDLDPFLQQGDHDTPHPPPKDAPYQQHPQQQFAPNPHQEAYNRPPLAKVDTEGQGYQQGGVDRYSPEQHQGLQQQPPPQGQPAYQGYAPPGPHSQNSNEYQAFQPPSIPSPHSGHSQDVAQQQQSYYQYQQQQQQQQQQQHSPQDQLSQPVQYHQQQFAPSPQSHQGQNFQQQHAQHPPPPPQHQQDFQNVPGAHPIPQVVQQNQQKQPVDTHHLQQLRPPSSQQNRAPPSPLQQAPQYQSYDSQPSQPTSAVEPHAESTSPPQQGQDSMAPASQPRQTLRKVNDSAAAPPGPPSREPSLLQQPPNQGQTPGQPPVSPGIPTFSTNVVPTVSQGQPFRGDKSPNPNAGAEMGRATPPPRSHNDMSEEEVANLVKEHEVLRKCILDFIYCRSNCIILGEKYQRVKKYFFELQTQVHQLQNSLANQRMSLSRTSWDDSEYATRFNRLDGLIAQMSFAIRKEWKDIPPWLQPVVNKTAVETGKQEMTAVGRAFVSSWLVENVFDKHFHPDLELGLSQQLKSVQLNLRRFAPVCHTSEDEDVLVTKIVNWRLATVEGLAELLRSPQSATNRESLMETLNEQLIGSLQMYLKDPAPPDLQGGVSMIVELAVGIAQHVPLESRDVHIEYFKPGRHVLPDMMKMESGVPSLTDPILDTADAASVMSVASKVDDNMSIEEQQAPQTSLAPKEAQDKKRGMFGFGSVKKPAQTPAQLGKRESSLGQGGSQQSLTQPPPGSSSGVKDEQPPQRVRMAVGLAVQIRGKSVLMKAPVYST
jgi:hypothetical protein